MRYDENIVTQQQVAGATVFKTNVNQTHCDFSAGHVVES